MRSSSVSGCWSVIRSSIGRTRWFSARICLSCSATAASEATRAARRAANDRATLLTPVVKALLTELGHGGADQALVDSGLAGALQAAFGRDTGVAVKLQPGLSSTLLEALERGELAGGPVPRALLDGDDGEVDVDEPGLRVIGPDRRLGDRQRREQGQGRTPRPRRPL